MYAFGFGIHNLQKALYIGRSEFLECAVLEDDIGYLVLLSDEGKCFIVNRISCLDLLGNGYLELVEENDLYLFSGVDIKMFTDKVVYLEFLVF